MNDLAPFDAPPTAAGFAEEAPRGRSVSVGRQRLVLDDCLAVLATLPPATFDVVVTSPPYNLGIKYSRHDDSAPRDRYLDWMSQVSAALARALRPGGSLFLNVGGSSADPWVPYDVAARFRRDFALQNDIKWVKSITVAGRSSGHFKPINSRRFLNNNHETVFHFTRSGEVPLDRLAIGVPFADKSNIARRGHAQDRRCDGNVWFVPYATVRSKAQKFDHPAGYPLDLPMRCLRLAGGSDLAVLDPFVGAGTTLVAAAALGHRGVGVDVDRDYLNRAYRRLRAAG